MTSLKFSYVTASGFAGVAFPELTLLVLLDRPSRVGVGVSGGRSTGNDWPGAGEDLVCSNGGGENVEFGRDVMSI